MKYHIFFFLLLVSTFSTAQINDNLLSKDFGIKGLVINKKYDNQIKDKCEKFEINFDGERNRILNKCKTKFTILEEKYVIYYESIDDVIFKVNIELDSYTPAVDSHIKHTVKRFIESAYFNLTDFSVNTREDFSKYANTLIARINEEYGNFNISSKKQSITPFVEGCLTKEVKESQVKWRKTILSVGNRSDRYDWAKRSLQEILDSNSSFRFLWVCLPIIDTCVEDNCLVDLYNFQWNKLDSNLDLNIYMPPNKNSFFFNYLIKINYQNNSTVIDVDKLIALQNEYSLNQRRRIDDENKRIENEKRDELSNHMNNKKLKELINKKKDF
jgi:hypothetical protein